MRYFPDVSALNQSKYASSITFGLILHKRGTFFINALYS